ncbi:FAD/NAD(P)-binding domain-containing protein [Mycena maculata]|uniref:FAD/NAD(P)-binding domain-containing protein n=1 Tax=Mycena maculata TaxID=230809 RepID=A0AAD7P1Z2_9AGAR|nr:FAD/NAD(P)-binding domain-containing protein [Mycena maculata]
MKGPVKKRRVRAGSTCLSLSILLRTRLKPISEISTQQDIHRPLSVVIVGAGIAGLAAAVALRRNGFGVQIYESAEFKTEIGAALGVPVNAQRVLEELGYSKENLKSVVNEGFVQFSPDGGAGQAHPWLLPSLASKPNLLCHRSDLHAELERLALGPGEGPPAVLHLARRVLQCDPEAGTLTLNDGTVVESDLIVGADGVSSVVRTCILGHQQKAEGSGFSVYRAVIEVSKLDTSGSLAWFNEGISGPRMIAKREGPFRMLGMYPCRNGTLINFVAAFADPHQNEPGWSAEGTRTEVQTLFADFHAQYQAVLAELPDQVLKWRLLSMPVLPTWVRGRAALVGDAAHTTLPTLGQGAALAIESAAALRALLPAGTARTDVPARLAAYEALRKPRGELVVRESLAQLAGPAKIKNRPQDGADSIIISSAAAKDLQEYLMEYDATKVAEEYLQEKFGGVEV